MCGICGIFDLTGRQRVNPAHVRAMTASIRHRGPDGDGFFNAPSLSMGMRRLSIIDVAGSDQPLYNEDGRLALVFNGEIYNYRELQTALRAAGHTLRTDGDGETLLHLYEQYGLDLFRHLRGMYAFALWDGPRERLVLAVDHIGMKPLYLCERDGRLHFASEAKALFAPGDLTPAFNSAALDTYLSFGYPLGEATLFEGVRRLMPGHVLVAERGTTHSTRYWQFGRDFGPAADTPPLPADEAALIEHIRQSLREAVRLHLRSDVPLGLFLSGGIDSAAVLALMQAELARPVQTYTVGFAGDVPDNELAHARRMAAHAGAQHHERIITAADWWAGLERYALAHDEPNANPSAVSMLLLAEMTAQQVKVVLTGLGGDELFGGYLHHRAIPALLRRQAAWQGRPGTAALAAGLGWLEQFYPAFKRYRLIGALPTYLPRLHQALLPPAQGLLRMQSYEGMVFSAALRERLYSADLKAAWHTAQHKERVYAALLADSQQASPAHTAQALVINTWLTGNALLSQDKVTMAHSLEARVPFFDPALFALAARLPAPLLLRGNKYLLRAALRPHLPEFALQRPKQPFSTPIRGWFTTTLKERLQAVLLDAASPLRPYFQPAALAELLRAHFSGQQKQEEVIFRLLNLALWQRAFFAPAHGTIRSRAHASRSRARAGRSRLRAGGPAGPYRSHRRGSAVAGSQLPRSTL
ncbi:MAG: asparagine synthase (glutamine-hydrolyzing) [Anaerolineae bacterium]|nr:asparagine synthase (glutamine-hydrolyzing) [Anaerolineae bacterium]